MTAGPQGGSLSDVKDVSAVAAGVDPVALDGLRRISGVEARELSVVTASGSPPAVHLSVDAGTVDVTEDLGGREVGELPILAVADLATDAKFLVPAHDRDDHDLLLDLGGPGVGGGGVHERRHEEVRHHGT